MNNEQQKRFHFFLGGRDLEMVTIQEILQKLGYSYSDRSLSWGAKISEYIEDVQLLDDETIPVFIELEIDDTLPKNSIVIDHHGEKSGCPSSIEQVAKLLGIILNRTQCLIAENDKGHIPGLKRFGATREEIALIRAQEMKILGITDEDRIVAQNDFANTRIEEITLKSGRCLKLYIVKTELKSFTPIVDSYYLNIDKPDTYSSLLVYSETSLFFTGKYLEIIKSYFEKHHGGTYYYGGYINRYIGTKKSSWSRQMIEDFVSKKVVEILHNMSDLDTVKSYHTFLYPFRWDYRDSNTGLTKNDFLKTTELDQRLNACRFIELLKETKKWQYQPFKIKTSESYNEQVYFYEYAQDVIYNTSDCKSEDGEISYYLEYEGGEEGTYEIKVQDKHCGELTYVLNLDGISLRVYRTGVAILGFNLINYRHDQFEDILKINDYGRRIYPQFLTNDNNKFSISGVQGSFLPLSVTLKLSDDEVYTEDFTYFNIVENVNTNPVRLPEYISRLFNKANEIFVTGDANDIKEKKVFIRHIIDDRMFTLSWVVNKDLIAKLKCYDKVSESYQYESDDDWFRLVFVDGDTKTCTSKKMTKKLLEQSTYDRWIDDNTLYGISRYSFICLNDGSWFARNIILTHVRTMYFQMFNLLLAQRASILRFADEVNTVSSLPDNELIKRTDSLYSKYLQFINKLYFREITAQEQGIELYNKAMDILQIEKHAKDLDAEIAELHVFSDMKKQKQMSERVEKLTQYGIPLMVASLVAGVLGMNTLPTNSIANFNWTGASLSLIFIFSLLAYMFIGFSSSTVKALLNKFIGMKKGQISLSFSSSIVKDLFKKLGLFLLMAILIFGGWLLTKYVMSFVADKAFEIVQDINQSSIGYKNEK